MSTPSAPSFPDTPPWDVSTEVAEWLLVQQVADLERRSRSEASRYEVLGISGILRAMIGDSTSVIDKARGRLGLPPPRFHFTPYAPEPQPTHRLVLGFAHVSQFAVPTVEGSLAQFRNATAAIYDGDAVSVLSVIKFFAQVQGGIHLGVPKLPFETLAHSVIGHLSTDVGRMWMRSLNAIAAVAIGAAQPIVDAIVADRPELAEGSWSEHRRLRAHHSSSHPNVDPRA